MALMTATMNITGSGFYPNGTCTITVTPYTGSIAGTVYTQSTAASSTGTISMSIPISSIPGIGTSTSIQVYATDVYTADASNIVTIPITITAVHPVLVGPSGGITLVSY